MYAYSSAPISINFTGLSQVGKYSATLYVPIGFKALYEFANEWKDFTNIVEMTTGLNDCISNKISIYQNPATGNYKINGLTDRANMNITDINGKLLITQTIFGNEELNINSLLNGVYVVTILSANKTVNCKIIK